MKTLSNTVIGIVAAASVASAQSHKQMDHAAMSDMTTTYVGCVETVNHGASYVLTHVSDEAMASHGGMAKDAAMMKMKDDAPKMKDGAMMKKDEPMMKSEDAAMNHASMAPAALRLTGLNMRKHLGQRLRVTGVVTRASGRGMSDDLDTLKASAVKIVAKSCSQ